MDSTSKEYWIDRFSKYNAPENIETHPPKDKEWYEDIKIPKDLAFNEISEPKELTPISAVIKSNFVFSPEAKMKIYAKARGIDPSRYSIQDNEIVFKGDDDKIYKEEASGVLPGIRKFALETATDPLTYFTGGAGYAARKIGAKAFILRLFPPACDRKKVAKTQIAHKRQRKDEKTENMNSLQESG